MTTTNAVIVYGFRPPEEEDMNKFIAAYKEETGDERAKIRDVLEWMGFTVPSTANSNPIDVAYNGYPLVQTTSYKNISGLSLMAEKLAESYPITAFLRHCCDQYREYIRWKVPSVHLFSYDS